MENGKEKVCMALLDDLRKDISVRVTIYPDDKDCYVCSNNKDVLIDIKDCANKQSIKAEKIPLPLKDEGCLLLQQTTLEQCNKIVDRCIPDKAKSKMRFKFARPSQFSSVGQDNYTTIVWS